MKNNKNKTKKWINKEITNTLIKNYVYWDIDEFYFYRLLRSIQQTINKFFIIRVIPLNKSVYFYYIIFHQYDKQMIFIHEFIQIQLKYITNNIHHITEI